MSYDRELLEDWCAMDDWGTYLERNGAFADDVSHERWVALEGEYFCEVARRIEYCRRLLLEHKDDPLVYLTLAFLHENTNLNAATFNLHKYAVRYYCLKVIHREPGCARAWALLSWAYEWLASIGEGSDLAREMELDFSTGDVKVKTIPAQLDRRVLKFIENAIHCLNKALKLDQMNEEYRDRLQRLYKWRNAEYGAGS